MSKFPSDWDSILGYLIREGTFLSGPYRYIGLDPARPTFRKHLAANDATKPDRKTKNRDKIKAARKQRRNSRS